MTQPVQTPAKLDPSRRLARKVMPFIAADSALLPPDTWIIATLKDMYKTVEPFKRDVRAAGVVAAIAVGGLVVAAGGAIALGVTGALTLASGVGAVVMAASSSTFAYWRGQRIWKRAQAETLPVLKEQIGKRYAAYKLEEIASAWRARRDAVRAAKASGATTADSAIAPVQEKPVVKKAASISLRDIFARKPANTDDQAAPKNAAPKAPPKP